MTMLASDYRLYYRNCMVGAKVGGEIKPFMVSEVGYNHHAYDPTVAYAESQGMDIEDVEEESMIPESFVYAPQAYEAMTFIGTLYDFAGNRISSETFNFNDLVLDNPDLGYLKIGDDFHYVEYRPIRAAKKGVTGERLSCQSLYLGGSIHQIMAAALNPVKPECVKLGGALLLRAEVEYKGRKIGAYDEASGTVTITCAEANYLKRFIERGVSGCRVVLQTAV